MVVKQLAHSPRIECSRKRGPVTVTDCDLTMSQVFGESKRPSTSFVGYGTFKGRNRFTRGCLEGNVGVTMANRVRANDCAGESKGGICAASMIMRRRRFYRDETRSSGGSNCTPTRRPRPSPTPMDSTGSFVAVPSGVRRLPFGWSTVCLRGR